MSDSRSVQRSCFRLDRSGLDDAAEVVRTFSARERLHPETAAKLQLILEELVTNAITHGRQHNGQPLEIELERCGEEIRLGYRDHGEPFVPPKGPVLPRRMTDKEGGFGWLLIRGFCSRVHHESAFPGNKLELTIPIV